MSKISMNAFTSKFKITQLALLSSQRLIYRGESGEFYGLKKILIKNQPVLTLISVFYHNNLCF